MIMYTSGTTGSPKGAMLTHGNLTWNCYNLLIDYDLTSNEVALISAPMFHTAALNHRRPAGLAQGRHECAGVQGSSPDELLRPDRQHGSP